MSTNNLPYSGTTLEEKCDWARTWVGRLRYGEYAKTLPDRLKNAGTTCGGVGNPIKPETGNKIQVEADYIGAGLYPLKLLRTFNSIWGNYSGANLWSLPADWGKQWMGSYSSKIDYRPSTASLPSALVYRPTGRVLYFVQTSSGIFTPDVDIQDQLTPLQTNGAITGWIYKDAADQVTETYDASGRLLSIKNQSGATQTLLYGANGQLQSVTDPSGRQLIFSYDSSHRVNTVMTPLGLYNYAYSTSGSLISVTYPDNTKKTYHYEDSRFPSYLTGITDESGSRFASYAYDSQGRAITSEHAGGVERVSLVYNADSSTSVTDALGSTRTYTFQTILGMVKPIGLSQACAGCGGNSQSYTYDVNGNVKSRIDFKGNRTSYIYDLSRNLETQRTEGLTSSGGTTSVTRTINTAWHATWRLPTIITEPLKKTSYAYGGDVGVACGAVGKVCTKTEQETSDVNGSQGLNAAAVGAARVWTYTYNANGQVLTVNGPRTDVNDITTYTYYTDTTATHRPGDLASITNALGHVTTFDSYDANGRPTSITPPSLQSTTISYTARGKIKSLSGEVNVTYNYDAADQLTQVSFTQGRTYTYAYDNAHRLLSIISGTGEKLSYTLDNAGNRLTSTLTDANGTIHTQHRQVFDALGQLQQSIATVQGLDATTSYTYDANGQLQTETSPLNEVTTYNYDPLNRINNTQEVLNGVILTTQTLQNGQDVSTSIQAPNGALTSYVPNGYGEITSESSPDRGAVTYTYDSAGNIKTRTDARNITLTYTYDALNRPLTLTSPVSADNITYTYDTNTTLTNCHGSGTAGKGHLCKVVDQSGTTAFAYDAQGNVTKLAKQINGVTSTFQFTYNAINQRITTFLPGNRYIINNRDSEKRIKSIDINLNGVHTPIVSNISYRPDGQVKTLSFNNGETLNNTYDAGGNLTLTSRSYGNTSEAFNRDLDGQLTSRVMNLTSYTRAFQYDELHRLKNEGIGTSIIQNFSYDNNGNRLGNTPSLYTYINGSNKLKTRIGVNVIHDAAGNVFSNGLGQTYTWNTLGQYTHFNFNGVKKATYLYNYLNQRIQKTLWNGTTVVSTTVYHYDPQGRLLMETSSTGAVQAVYIYADDNRPLVMIQAANSPYNNTALDRVFYLQTDHLGTARAATDAAKRVVWRWESDAFGTSAPQQDPDGDGIATIINLRLPGQYYDVESGLHQNWNRTYDPVLGRYISSDPIGLAGGLNTYGYVGQSPLNQVDMNGLCPFCAAVMPFLGGSTTASSTGLGFWATGAVVGGGLVVATLPGDTSSQGADSSSTDESESCSPTEHAKDRAEQAKTDEHRQVGDPNKVLEKGRKFLDTDTGNIVHVDGDRVVITDSNGRRITQFKNTKKNTQDRVRSGRWIPM